MKKRPEYEHVGTLMKLMREEAGYTQSQLAKLLKLSQGQISHLEQGRVEPFYYWPRWLKACCTKRLVSSKDVDKELKRLESVTAELLHKKSPVVRHDNDWFGESFGECAMCCGTELKLYGRVCGDETRYVWPAICAGCASKIVEYEFKTSSDEWKNDPDIKKVIEEHKKLTFQEKLELVLPASSPGEVRWHSPNESDDTEWFEVSEDRSKLNGCTSPSTTEESTSTSD